MEPQPPIVTAPIPVPPETPKPKNNSFLIVLLSVLLLLATSLAFFLALQTQKLSKQLAQLQVQVIPTPSVTPDITAGWKTYINSQYKFSLKYPSDWGTLDKFGGSLMIAPVSDIENVSKTFKDNISEGGYDGGKQLISLLSITEGLSGSSSDQYWEVVKTSIQIDNKTAEKYVSTNIKDTPNGKFFKGDIETEILIPLKDNFIMSYTLIDQRYATIFDQILSTFKFLD